MPATDLPTSSGSRPAATRVDWIDYARGLCVLLIVVLHVIVEMWTYHWTPGPVGTLMRFAETLRLPGLFLVSGLLLGPVIDRPWRHYLDRKLLHFWYFFALWMTLEYLLRAEWRDAPAGRDALTSFAIHALNNPGPLWFILLLPVFYVLAKLLRGLSAPAVLAGAIAINLADPQSGLLFIDATAERFVYFVIGWLYAPQIGRFAAGVARRPLAALALIALWCGANGWATLAAPALAKLPIVHLPLSIAGALVAVAVAALTAQLRGFGWLAYCGRRSIVVYLAHSLPIHFLLLGLSLTGLHLPGMPLTLAVTALAIACAFAIERLLRPTPLRWLFMRPPWAWLSLPVAPRGPVGKRPISAP